MRSYTDIDIDPHGCDERNEISNRGEHIHACENIYTRVRTCTLRVSL